MEEGDSNHKVEVYGECVRNHAASLGALATDGCGEFTLDETRPRLLKCDACGCHRNFHRKFKVTVREDRGRVLRGESSNARGKEPIMFEVPEMPDIPEAEMTVVMDHLVEEVVQQDVVQPNMFRAQETKRPLRKRPRTKFTDNQKKKMFTFAEEINWKLRRKEQKEIDEFCDEVGVPRNVFMVWMHNHKRLLSSSRTKK